MRLTELLIHMLLILIIRNGLFTPWTLTELMSILTVFNQMLIDHSDLSYLPASRTHGEHRTVLPVVHINGLVIKLRIKLTTKLTHLFWVTLEALF